MWTINTRQLKVTWHNLTTAFKHSRLTSSRNCREVFLVGICSTWDWGIILFGLHIFEWFLNCRGKHKHNYECQGLHLPRDWSREEVGPGGQMFKLGTHPWLPPSAFGQEGKWEAMTEPLTGHTEHSHVKKKHFWVKKWAASSSSRGANALSSRDPEAANGYLVLDCSVPAPSLSSSSECDPALQF